MLSPYIALAVIGPALVGLFAVCHHVYWKRQSLSASTIAAKHLHRSARRAINP